MVEESDGAPVSDQSVELVERKGRGHPDSICDAVAERISVALSKAYRDAFGRILHHNLDKSLLVAGTVERWFGGGRVVEPMRLIIGDRASFGIGAHRVPVGEIAIGAARQWFKEQLPHVDPDADVRYQVELKPGSAELQAIFEASGGLLAANDTSVGVGYAPLSATEQLVLYAERFLNGSRFKRAFPETGQDVKIMALRMGRDINLTVAMPLLARAIRSEAAYFRLKERIAHALVAEVRRQPGGWRRVQVTLNALDRQGHGEAGLYLSLLGTSAEQGDSGEVGRGNRVAGVIPFNRPMSLEAAAGKNPVSHVGKIYNVLARDLATQLHERVEGVREATVWLLSAIGRRIDQPALIRACVAMAPGHARGAEPAARRVLAEGLAGIGRLCEDLAAGRYPVA